MRYNQLGRTGLFVSELCLGTMTFGGQDRGLWHHIGRLEQEAVDLIVARALAAGINFIDTADIYSDGRSEELLAQSLRNLEVKRSDVVIATKFYGHMGKGPNDRSGSRGHIMELGAAEPRAAQDGLYRPLPNSRLRPGDAARRDFAGT